MTEERRRQPSVLIVLLAAALATYFVDLGGSSIWDANEAFYVETPREMIEHGDYVSPTFNYEPRLNKPVLSYWIVAAFYHLFGVSVGVQRLPIALGALVLVASAFFLARAAWCDGSSRATEAGLWAALGLAIAPRFLMFARRIFIDIYISMFLSLSLLFFVLSERHPHRRRLWLVLMYVSIGLGMLTKGPVAAVLPAFALAAYFLLHGQRRRVREMMIPAGAAIVLAIVVPWYAALYVRDGWTYITAFFLGENVARFTDGYGVQSARGPLFYIPVVFGDSFPWSVFLPAAAATWVADLRQRRHLDTSPALRVRNLLWLWILTIVGFFTLSAAKQDLYILPIVPAVAALGGLAIVRGTDGVEGRASGLVRALVAVLGAALFFLGAAVILLFGGSGAVYGLKGAIVMGAVAVCAGAATLVLAVRRHVRTGLLVSTAGMIALNWIFVVRALPSFEAYKPVPGFARMLQRVASPADVVVTYNVALPSLVYYLERHVEMAYDPAPVLTFLEAGRAAYVIMPRTDYDRLAPSIGRPTCIISSQGTFDVKLRNVLARDPVPDLVLATNRCGPAKRTEGTGERR